MTWLLWSALMGCHPPQKTEPLTPQFLIVLVNGLRSDSPQASVEEKLIEQMGRRPHRHFNTMYATSASKNISFASLLTGDYPSAIPICGKPGENKSRQDLWCSSIPQTRHTLPEILEIYGYKTAFFNADVSDLSDMGRGFSELHQWSTEGANHKKDWTLLRHQLTSWWSKEDHPKLAIISLDLMGMDLKKAASQAYLNYPLDAEEQAAVDKKYPAYQPTSTTHIQWPFLSRAGAESFKEAYEAEVEKIGTEIQKSLVELQKVGDTKGLWVFVTSLRGVSLGELGGVSHPEQHIAGMSAMLLDRSLRIPLMIWGPPSHEPTVTEPVEIIDLLPSLTELAHIPSPQGIAGHSLFQDSTDHSAYAEFGDMLVLREDDWFLSFREDIHGISSLDPRLTQALIQSTPSHIRNKVFELNPNQEDMSEKLDHFTLFHLGTDPNQTQNLIAEEPDTFARMAYKLLFRRLNEAAPPKESMSFEQVEALNQNGVIHYW